MHLDAVEHESFVRIQSSLVNYDSKLVSQTIWQSLPWSAQKKYLTITTSISICSSLHVDVCLHACSVMSDSLLPHGLWPVRLLCPRNSPGKNTRVGSHFLLQGIFLTQQLNLSPLRLLFWQVGSLTAEPPEIYSQMHICTYTYIYIHYTYIHICGYLCIPAYIGSKQS